MKPLWRVARDDVVVMSTLSYSFLVLLIITWAKDFYEGKKNAIKNPHKIRK